SEGDAGGAIEVELSAARIEGKPRLEPKLARSGHEARTQTPHDALAMETPRVQPHLAAMIGIDRLEVVSAQQHAKVHREGAPGVDGELGVALAAAAGAFAEIRRVSHGILVSWR